MMQTLIRLIADGTLVPIVLIGVYALLFRLSPGSRYEAYCRILMAGITAFLVAKYMAIIIQPSGQRPFEQMGVEPGAAFLPNPGFPSDHALFAAAITFAVWFESRSRTLAWILIVLTLLVCAGRVLALVHTPLDVAGGLVAASIGAVWYLNRLPQKTSKHAKS